MQINYRNPWVIGGAVCGVAAAATAAYYLYTNAGELVEKAVEDLTAPVAQAAEEAIAKLEEIAPPVATIETLVTTRLIPTLQIMFERLQQVEEALSAANVPPIAKATSESIELLARNELLPTIEAIAKLAQEQMDSGRLVINVITPPAKGWFR